MRAWNLHDIDNKRLLWIRIRLWHPGTIVLRIRSFPDNNHIRRLQNNLNVMNINSMYLEGRKYFSIIRNQIRRLQNNCASWCFCVSHFFFQNGVFDSINIETCISPPCIVEVLLWMTKNSL